MEPELEPFTNPLRCMDYIITNTRNYYHSERLGYNVVNFVRSGRDPVLIQINEENNTYVAGIIHLLLQGYIAFRGNSNGFIDKIINQTFFGAHFTPNEKRAMYEFLWDNGGEDIINKYC